MAVTLKDVSQHANVSVSSVSDVLNGRDMPYSDALRERVFRAAKELGYKPNSVARGLRTGLSNTIGLVIPNRNYSYFADIAMAIERQAKSKGLHIITVFATNAEEITGSYLDELMELRARQVDGIIATPMANNDEIAAAYQQMVAEGQHIVLVDVEIPSVKAPFVGSDDYTSAREATDYLISRGHRRIAHLSAPYQSSTGQARLDGYRSAMEVAGLGTDPSLVCGRSYLLEDGVLAVQQILDLKELPTAVFCASDVMAAQLYRGCWERGIKIPDDISVVGYSGLNLSEYLTPPLTTMVQPAGQIGRKAMDILYDRIHATDQSEDIPNIKYKSEIIERYSVRSI